MKKSLSIFKIGGNVIENAQELHSYLLEFTKVEGPKILVHGGGRRASQILPKLGIEPKMVNGRRITDAATLDVVVMVYGGLVNKKIVARLQAFGTNAIGMSGADADSIKAHKRLVKEIDFGFAGDVDGVDGSMLTKILNLGLVPVFCALTHDGKGQLLNTNADTIASELAVGLSNNFRTTLNFCFEFAGVLKDVSNQQSVIEQIDSKTYKALMEKGIITGGMLPKLHNCFQALEQGVQEVRIGNLGLFDVSKSNYTSLIL